MTEHAGSKAQHLQTGERAENLAARYLQQKGLDIIHRNFRCRMGEIDLIAKTGDYLVFVEVRFRTHDDLVSAEESITWKKRKKLIRTAQYYLQHHTHGDQACRFDVLALKPGKPGRWRVNWICNAFGADG